MSSNLLTHRSSREPRNRKPRKSASHISRKSMGRMSGNGLVPVSVVKKDSCKVLSDVDPAKRQSSIGL